MDEILKLLKDGYEKLMELVSKAESDAASAKVLKEKREEKLAKLEAAGAELAKFEAELKARAEKIGGAEDVAEKLLVLKGARDAFDSFKNSEEKRLAQLKAEVDEAYGQMKLRREKLDTEAATLKKERETYKDQVREEIKAALGV